MAVDIYHTRRTNYKLCQYWNRDESTRIGDASKWVLANKPTGSFYARPESQTTNSANPVANAMMFDRNTVTLCTEDHVDDIKKDSMVLYNGKVWGVVNVQFAPHKKESEFSNEGHYTTYISLRR